MHIFKVCDGCFVRLREIKDDQSFLLGFATSCHAFRPIYNTDLQQRVNIDMRTLKKQAITESGKRYSGKNGKNGKTRDHRRHCGALTLTQPSFRQIYC
jgi:hypothetical protein